MNRLPRRPQRVQPPLRGRSAAVPPFGQTQHCSTPIVRKRPPGSGPFTGREFERNGHDDIHPQLLKLLKVLNHPWKWLVVLTGLVFLSMGIGSLL